MQNQIQQEIDHLLDLQNYSQIHATLSDYMQKQQQRQKYKCMIKQIKQTFPIEPQNKITLPKLYALQAICQIQIQKSDQPINVQMFKCNNIYQLVSVTKGHLNATTSRSDVDVKGNFGRNLKKNSLFWGVVSIQNMYSSIINKTIPVVIRPAQIKIRQYLWQFVAKNIDLFPAGFDFYQYALKHMLMLRTDQKQQMITFNIILEIFAKYQHSYYTVSRNFKFILEFFRSSLNQKQMGGFFPYGSCQHILKIFSVYQVDNIFAMGSLGLNWTQNDVLNCINNVLKLGVTQQNYRLMKPFIQMFKSAKKYIELAHAYQKNLSKIFVFLKFPQLYSAALKTLKQFVLGPYPTTTLYSNFAVKAIEYSKAKKQQIQSDFILFLVCVINKYKDTTLVNDLQELIKSNVQNNDYEKTYTAQKIRAEILQYDWRVFQKINLLNNQGKTIKQTDSSCQNRGIINIGNSCYLNSFLQCLFMTKQYRIRVMEARPLQVQKIILSRNQQLFPNHTKQGRNLSLISRQTVRPLAELQRTFGMLLKSKRPSINPTNIRNIAPIEFRNSFQHDSIQFGRFLIQAISKSIDHVFEGRITTQIECPYCGARRQKNQQFLDFMLSASNRDVQTVQTMVQTTLQDELIEGLVCQICHNTYMCKQQPVQQQGINQQIPIDKTEIKEECRHQHTKEHSKIVQNMDNKNGNTVILQKQIKSVKRHWISKFPNYLILTLKRFEYSIKQSKNIKKPFKLELNQQFKIQSVQYALYCFIVHRGVSANSGHYFVFSRSSYQQQNKGWLCLNDSLVNKIQNFDKVIQFLQSNQQDTPYILFAINKQYWLQNIQKIQRPINLRPNVQSFIEKDDAQYVKSQSNKGKIDLSMLKFATGTGSFYKKDQDDNNDPYGGMGGFGNNPIM